MSNDSAQDWIDDLTDPSDDSDDAPSLFEENFRKMVEDGDVADMAVSTLEGQVERIDDPSILSEAMDVDDREEARDLYQQRVASINKQRQDDTDEPGENRTDDVVEMDDEGESDEEEDVTAVVDDLVSVDEDETDESSETAPTAGSEEMDDEDDPDIPDEDGSSSDGSQTAHNESESDPDGGSVLPDVDVASLAPDAVSREQAAERDKQRTLLVWGPEGSGKSHIAHTAPEPICYIDTEGKADELAEKFDKRIHYWVADDYKEAKAAMEQALDVLGEYLDHGVRGTIVVDSMTAMWEYAKVDYAKFAYQTDDLTEVNFQSELEGEKDWTKIKARHNEAFRETILDSPFHVVFTSGQKEEYGEVFEGGGKKWVPDGEKWNRYAVKDVVRLRRGDSGKSVADLKKAAKTRYSFSGLEWPTWDKIHGAIDEIYAAEQADDEIDVTDWPFSVIDGQPIGNEPEPSDGEDGGDDDGE